MSNGILRKTYAPPPFDRQEILRYAGCKRADERLTALLEECLTECAAHLSYRVCYRVLSVEELYAAIEGARESVALGNRLQGCDQVILFAASVGLGIDRFMERYARIAPTKALFFQAIGAERIESLCRLFCEDMQREYGKTAVRFSAGYGDFPLTAQKGIVNALDCARKIGVSLTDSLLMTPTKSVTAVVGIYRE